MPTQASTLIVRSAAWRKLRALIGLTLFALTGCFGAEAMHYDIQEYNKQALSSEKQMLLYNIGALHEDQPPHFMMLSSVSQSRTFSGTAGFKWANPATWSVPFSATNTESPTIQFVPIQGSDFVQRFESPLTDKFVTFLEDQRWYGDATDEENLLLLSAQSLFLIHGDDANTGKCPAGLYVNKIELAPDDRCYYKWPPSGECKYPKYPYDQFKGCLEEFLPTHRYFQQIDGHYPVPTTRSIAPLGADVVTALGAGYEWTEGGGEDPLTTAIRIPAWFDYDPQFVTPPDSNPDSNPPLPLVWSEPAPKWQNLQYTLPKNYQWKTFKTVKNYASSADVYALVPDGYDLARDKAGKLEPPDKNGHYVPVKIKDSDENDPNRISYADDVVKTIWPVTKDYFYIELRKNGQTNAGITDAIAKGACFPEPSKTNLVNGKVAPANNVVCGYLKIGNLLQIMHRLAKMSCPYQDQEWIDAKCTQSIFGVAKNLARIPCWAENSAPYQGLTGRLTGPYVYVPAHDPKVEHERTEKDRTHRNLAERDSRMFFDLYKLY
jgi:hypothetical protein